MSPAAKKSFLLAVLLPLVLVITLGLGVGFHALKDRSSLAEKPGVSRTIRSLVAEGTTRKEITSLVATPDKSETVSDSHIAVPINVIGEGKGAIRMFKMEASGGKYIPDTLVVNESDVVDLTLSATDADYNIFFPDFGVSKIILKGESGHLQFQAYPFGEYKFYCLNLCENDVIGTLIVNKK